MGLRDTKHPPLYRGCKHSYFSWRLALWGCMHLQELKCLETRSSFLRESWTENTSRKNAEARGQKPICFSWEKKQRCLIRCCFFFLLHFQWSFPWSFCLFTLFLKNFDFIDAAKTNFSVVIFFMIITVSLRTLRNILELLRPLPEPTQQCLFSAQQTQHSQIQNLMSSTKLQINNAP